MAHFKTGNTAAAAKIRAGDVYQMSVRLLARHGPAACDVAAFAKVEQSIRGDAERSAAWKAVESTVGDMIARRLGVTGITIH